MASPTHDTPAETPINPLAKPSPSRGQSLHVICLSSQPWRADLPTNRQQIMARVARNGHRVLFVETGLFFGRHLLQLVREKGTRRSLLRQLFSTESVASGVQVMKAPNLAPWGHRYRRAARANSKLTARVIRRRLQRRRSDSSVLWLYDPCFAECIGQCGEQFAVYDCVDDYAEQAGPDARKRVLVSEHDTLAASRARLVFATAKTLAERHRAHNAKTHLVRNAGDFIHFAPAADRSHAASGLSALRRPVIGFAGNFLVEKVDFALLEAVAVRRPEWTVLLVGPAREDTQAALDRLAARENVHWLGPRAYEDLPRYVAAFDVATIPYLWNAYTRSCFPLKTFEYLAAGKPVVASGLPELEGMGPHVRVADDVEAFIARIESALARTSESDISARQEIAAKHTWETRTGRLLTLVAAEL